MTEEIIGAIAAAEEEAAAVKNKAVEEAADRAAQAEVRAAEIFALFGRGVPGISRNADESRGGKRRKGVSVRSFRTGRRRARIRRPAV